MSALKRKERPGAAPVSKSARPSSESRPSKRSKPSDSTEDGQQPGAKKAKDGKQTKGATPLVSVIREEEPMFPRGGGSVLTPLEHKKIQIQAKKDALFDDESGLAKKKVDKGAKKQKKKKKRKSEAEVKPARDGDAVKIESLNFKACLLRCPGILSFPFQTS